MSEDEQNEQTSEDSEHSDEQPLGSEPAQESEAAEQPEEQSGEQSGEKPTDESEQATEQPGESSGETAEQADETSGGSDVVAGEAAAKGELSAKRQSMLDLIDKWMPTSLNKSPRARGRNIGSDGNSWMDKSTRPTVETGKRWRWTSRDQLRRYSCRDAETLGK
jgi:hypothetical protein